MRRRSTEWRPAPRCSKSAQGRPRRAARPRSRGAGGIHTRGATAGVPEVAGKVEAFAPLESAGVAQLADQLFDFVDRPPGRGDRRERPAASPTISIRSTSGVSTSYCSKPVLAAVLPVPNVAFVEQHGVDAFGSPADRRPVPGDSAAQDGDVAGDVARQRLGVERGRPQNLPKRGARSQAHLAIRPT